jgi:hypothetical protein
MKASGNLVGRLIVGCVFACCLPVLIQTAFCRDTSQLAETSLLQNQIGTFYSLKHPEWPPLPGNSRGLPVLEINGFYYLDDREVDYQATTLSAMQTASFDGLLLEGTGTSSLEADSLPDISNYLKYQAQSFLVIDTNSVAANDTNLYNALLGFADDTNTAPTLQILPYGDHCLLLKASHFDYSSEMRDFCLVVCDKLETPLFKSIDLSNPANNIQNGGWLVQGSVPYYQVADTMFLMVSNTSRLYNGFFRAIPYGGPEVTLTGYSDYEIVSNTISIQANITDLSGITNIDYQLAVGGLPARFSLGTSNTFNLDTPYSPNGLSEVKLAVCNAARVYDANNIPDNGKIFFSGEHSLYLDFENGTFLAFASDWCSPEVGTNYVYFYVDQARHIEASIAKTNGDAVATFSGDTSGATYIALPWDFTESDGETSYSNDTYIVAFAASSGEGTNSMSITNVIDKDGNIRPPNGCLLTYQWDDPSDPTWSYINDKADQAIAGNLLYLYQDIYGYFSLTQYGPGDVGTNRNAAQCHPYNAPYKTWGGILGQLTNYYYSELTIGGAHGTGGFLGGAKYLTNTIDSSEFRFWVRGYSDKQRWRLRKATFFACYSADINMNTLGYPNWSDACGIRPRATQLNSLMYKNCGIFFGDVIRGGYGDTILGGQKTPAEIAAILDQTWVCGENQYPGGCDPTYSWWYACQSTVNRFQNFTSSQPSLAGSPYCIYTSIYDDLLRNLNYLPVKNKP